MKAFTPTLSYQIDFRLTYAPERPCALYGFKTEEEALRVANRLVDPCFSLVQITRVEKRTKFGPWIRTVISLDIGPQLRSA